MSEAGESGPRLSVYIDYKSPAAFLAKDPTYALEDEFELEIDWRPLTPDHSSRREGNPGPEETKGERHSRVRAEYARMDQQRYARAQDLTLKHPSRDWDSTLAGIGLIWAKEQGRIVLRGYTDRVFERFWRQELDIESPAALEGILSEAGANVEGFGEFAQGDGRVIHGDVQSAAQELGVFDVPSYSMDGEIFLGHQHLPMIRWLLSDRRGQPPV